MRAVLSGPIATGKPVPQMKSYSRGFTLSELLLAAAILVFVLAGLLALFINCLLLNEANRNLSAATTHAQYIMEQIKDAAETDFTPLAANINSGNWDLNASQIGSSPYNLTALSNENIDTAVSQSGNPLGVSVTVQWDDRPGRSRSTQLDTLIADYQ